MAGPSPVMVQHMRDYPFGLDDHVMDNNEFEVDEMQVGGGFFDDDPLMGSSGRGGRQDIRSHLDDLAQRHPEFADSLRGPPWAGGGGGLRRTRFPSGSAGDEAGSTASGSSGASSSSGGATAASGSAPPEPQEQADEPGPLRGRLPPQHGGRRSGLRNTVPDMVARAQDEEGQRGQRSWSAPPDSRAKQQQSPRFVSRLEINPVNPDDGDKQQNTANQEYMARPPPAPRPQQQQQQQQPQQQQQAPKPTGNVRHIPIFVEGRDEPVVPRANDTDTVDSASQQPQFTSQHQFTPAQQQQQQQQKRQNTTPNRSFNKSPRPFQAPQQEQQPESSDEVSTSDVENAAPPPPVKVFVDPISKVEAIQAEVEKLRLDVEKYSGNSRRDKDYMYIDEMLTRNLLKLDDIETEGRTDIRMARKSAIRSIQECISTLEDKVPMPRASQPTEDVGMEVALCDGKEVVSVEEKTGEEGQSEATPENT